MVKCFFDQVHWNPDRTKLPKTESVEFYLQHPSSSNPPAGVLFIKVRMGNFLGVLHLLGSQLRNFFL